MQFCRMARQNLSKPQYIQPLLFGIIYGVKCTSGVLPQEADKVSAVIYEMAVACRHAARCVGWGQDPNLVSL